MTDKSQLTVGETLELVRGFRDLGVLRAKFGELEVEFAFVAPVEVPTKFMTHEEKEEAAEKLRKEILEEAFAAA